MIQTRIFLFGTLRCDALRAVVLGERTPAQAARLMGHSVCGTPDGLPVLSRSPDGAADGIVVSVDDTQLSRLDFYEALFGYHRQPVQVDMNGESCAAQVYAPQSPVGLVSQRAWDLDAWQALHGGAACLAARDLFQLWYVHGVDALRVRYPMLLAHAASRLRARGETPAITSRRKMAEGDVLSRQSSHPYSYFFGVQVDDLQFRRFDGTLSPIVRRAAFVMADAVTVLPYDPVRDRVMVVEQFRYGAFIRGDRNPWILEPIAGRIDGGEDPRAAALRELAEEARLSLPEGALMQIGGTYPSPGAISEFLFNFVAICDLPDDVTGVAGLESEAEDIRSHLLPFDRAFGMIATGEAQNAPLIQSLYWLALNRDRLRGGATR